MALNKVFTGNMFDKDGVAISDILVKGFHQVTGIWSTVYDTGVETQYNVNLGDGGWLTQDGAANSGDKILLVFETKEVDPLNRQFAMYEFDMTSADTYVQDIQLMDVQVPNVDGLWDISSSVDGNTTFDNQGVDCHIGRVNDLITATANYNDNYTWVYAGVTLKHVPTYIGEDIFTDRVGVATTDFDWTEDDTFVTGNTHTYTLISDQTASKLYAVEGRATNLKGLITTGFLYIQIRYNTPIPDIDWSPVSPSVLDTFVLTGLNQDVDSRITNIEYNFDSVLVANNTTLGYSWQQNLGTTYIQTRVVESNITWNDGFTSLDIPHSENITMTNLAPSFTLIQTVQGDPTNNDVIYTATNLTDPDGDDADLELKWVIEYKTPFDNTYKVVYESGYPTTPNLDPKEWIFSISGDYRITATAKDGSGLEYSESVVSIFDYSAACDGTGKIKLNNNVWQLIAIPVANKTVNEYFLNKVEAILKTYDTNLTSADAIETCNAYPGQLNKFLSFVPGFTSAASEHNFSHVINDGININEVTAFWVKMKDYQTLTNGDNIVVSWDQQD